MLSTKMIALCSLSRSLSSLPVLDTFQSLCRSSFTSSRSFTRSSTLKIFINPNAPIPSRSKIGVTSPKPIIVDDDAEKDLSSRLAYVKISKSRKSWKQEADRRRGTTNEFAEAKTKLDKAESKPAMAESKLTEVKTELIESKTNLSDSKTELATAEAKLATAESELTISKANLATAESELTISKANLETAEYVFYISIPYIYLYLIGH